MQHKSILLLAAMLSLPATALARHNDWRISAAQHNWAIHYAETAVRQARAALRLGCAYRGNRWSTNFRQHYDWALRERRHKGEVEIDRRANALRHCSVRYGQRAYRHHDHGWRGRDSHRGWRDFNRGRDRGRRGRGHGRG